MQAKCASGRIKPREDKREMERRGRNRKHFKTTEYNI